MTLRFTPRQAEVLELIGRDRLTYAATAERLGISSRTVADHAAAVRDRAGLDGRPRDACLAIWADARDELE